MDELQNYTLIVFLENFTQAELDTIMDNIIDTARSFDKVVAMNCTTEEDSQPESWTRDYDGSENEIHTQV